LIDIVSIFCTRDIPSIKLQAESIRRFVDAEILNKIIYVFNEEEHFLDQKDRADLEYILSGFDFDLLNYRELEGGLRKKEADGWISQQSLKLQVAVLVETDFYLVLDSKNHFVRNTYEVDFFTTCGRPKMPIVNYSNFKADDLNFYFDYFDIERIIYNFGLIVNVTPFIMCREFALALGEYLQSKEGMRLNNVFDKYNKNITEFMAYQFYLIKLGIKIEDFYSDCERIDFALWKHEAKNKRAFRDSISRARSGNCAIFSIHWISFVHLSRPQVEALKDFWLKCGLMDTEAEAERYFHDQKNCVENFIRKVERDLENAPDADQRNWLQLVS